MHNHATMIRSKWIPLSAIPMDMRARVEAAAARAVKGAGWNPKSVNLRRDMWAIDYSFHPNGGGISSVNVARIVDHPHLAELNKMKNVPRAVKAIYRKDVRRAHLMADSAWPYLAAHDAAEASWDAYLKNHKRAGEMEALV